MYGEGFSEIPEGVGARNDRVSLGRQERHVMRIYSERMRVYGSYTYNDDGVWRSAKMPI